MLWPILYATYNQNPSRWILDLPTFCTERVKVCCITLCLVAPRPEEAALVSLLPALDAILSPGSITFSFYPAPTFSCCPTYFTGRKLIEETKLVGVGLECLFSLGLRGDKCQRQLVVWQHMCTTHL